MFLFWGRVWGVFGCGDAVDDLATASVQQVRTSVTTVTKMKPKFIFKIGELERRQTKAKQEANQKLLLACFASWKMTAAKSAKDEAHSASRRRWPGSRR